MKWLARIDLDTDVVRRERIFDSYAWHKKIWECFPNRPDAGRTFLTRIDQLENAFRIWVLAPQKPVCPAWCLGADFALKEISSPFLSHRYYAFDLRANPVKAQVQRDAAGQPVLASNGRHKRGRRIPLVKEDELKAWLVRKGQVRCLNMNTKQPVPGGFRILEERPLEIRPMVENHFRKREHSAYHGGVQFRGALEVTDREHFIQTYRSGIGSAKGFGFGLLLLAPLNL